MSREVPSGWNSVELNDLTLTPDGLQTGPFGSQLKASEYTGSGIPVVMPSDIVNGKINVRNIARVPEATANRLEAHKLMADDIVFARRGDIGRCSIVRQEQAGYLCGTGCLRARLNPALITAAFADHLFKSAPVVEWLNEHAVGQTMLNLNTAIISKIPLRLPPLHEQRRIAEILSSVDEGIAATRAVIEQTRKVKQGVLERLLTKGIGHTRFKQTEIGEIPEGWEVAEVQEHFHVQLGKMLSKAAKVGGSPSPYLRNANVQWGRIDTEDVLYMDFSEQEKEKFRLQPGDLLVCEGGEVGRCAIWNDEREMYYQKALHRLRERTGVVKNQFLMYVLLRVFTSKALSAGLVGTNSIAHFTREQFLRLKFSVPDAEEQNVICEILGALDVSINENISKMEALLSTKFALMSDLLTGRKRVTDTLPMAAE